MTTTPYTQGKIKVVWIEKDPKVIRSKMFDYKKEALLFAKNKENFLVFSLEKQNNMEEFVWTLLPYGRHRLYLTMIGAFQTI